jgi:hypothetical protein
MRRTGVRLFPFALALVAAAGLPQAAGASTVGRDGNGVLVYQAAVGESNSVSLDPDPTAGKVEITDSGFPGSITPGLGCANDVLSLWPSATSRRAGCGSSSATRATA